MSVLVRLPRASVSPGEGHRPTSLQPALALAKLNFLL